MDPHIEPSSATAQSKKIDKAVPALLLLVNFLQQDALHALRARQPATFGYNVAKERLEKVPPKSRSRHGRKSGPMGHKHTSQTGRPTAAAKRRAAKAAATASAAAADAAAAAITKRGITPQPRKSAVRRSAAVRAPKRKSVPPAPTPLPNAGLKRNRPHQSSVGGGGFSAVPAMRHVPNVMAPVYSSAMAPLTPCPHGVLHPTGYPAMVNAQLAGVGIHGSPNIMMQPAMMNYPQYYSAPGMYMSAPAQPYAYGSYAYPVASYGQSILMGSSLPGMSAYGIPLSMSNAAVLQMAPPQHQHMMYGQQLAQRAPPVQHQLPPQQPLPSIQQLPALDAPTNVGGQQEAQPQDGAAAHSGEIAKEPMSWLVMVPPGSALKAQLNNICSEGWNALHTKVPWDSQVGPVVCAVGGHDQQRLDLIIRPSSTLRARIEQSGAFEARFCLVDRQTQQPVDHEAWGMSWIKCTRDQTTRLDWQGNTKELAMTTSRARHFHPSITMSAMHDCWLSIWFNREVGPADFCLESQEGMFDRLRVPFVAKKVVGTGNSA